MLTLDDLSKRVEEYQAGSISLDDFEDWFRDNSRGAYRNHEVGAACASIEAAFSRYRFEGVSESVLRKELENAALPFERTLVIVFRAESPQRVSLRLSEKPKKKEIQAEVRSESQVQTEQWYCA